MNPNKTDIDNHDEKNKEDNDKNDKNDETVDWENEDYTDNGVKFEGCFCGDCNDK